MTAVRAVGERPTRASTAPRLAHDVFETSWGWVAVAGSQRGLRFLTLPEAVPERAATRLAELLKGAAPEEQPGAFADFHRQLEAYFAGGGPEWDVTLDLSGAPAFFQSAWEACRTIPAGETRSYGWLAAQTGRPRAVRAAGQAMARNPLPLVIPCHRVVAADGALHGFGGAGVGLKARLLELERATAGRSTAGYSSQATSSSDER